ncbi:ASCH domain-containing protein [Nostoc sp. TCL26-01]|uniref:ASCH domain-containing protein n=1 Tax=Nostoc sp. TCL26-01 TaxID=2576904 RepID=UPI0015BF6FD8|nr:ASCH domain-containing protein [Nostoc sp. TCL26-01]QLE54976.1 ASCH domain-containing protein [Nostoc sp. TCL26-01]
MEINYPAKLKAISLHPPYAYAIIRRLKHEEYRSKPTKRKGWILIHASKSTASDDCFQQYGINPANIKRGAIIGACKIISCRQAGFDNYAYQLSEAFEFRIPIDCAGSQSIFWGATNEDRKVVFTLASEQIRSYLLK